MQATQSSTTFALDAALYAIGYVDGAPAHVAPALVAVDRRVYRVMKCAACGHRGQTVKAFHRGQDYRLVCSCKKCGEQVEA